MKVCRLCLAKDADFPVFSVSTAVKIMACTSVEVDPTDGLPQLICPGCRLRLEEYHHFRRRCQVADRRLRRDARIDLEDEDNDALQDVAKCTANACSESNAQWRKQAAQLIRNEINAYKRELLANCKQTVRQEIEEEVRREIETVLLEQARQQVRLGVLNDLFEEVEDFFIRKRNETAYEHFNGSESVSSEMVDKFYEGELPQLDDLNPVNVSLVDLVDLQNSSNSEIPACSVPSASEVIVPVPMVEINMTNTQLSHLREEFHSDIFLGDQNPPKTAKKIQEVPSNPEPIQKKVRFSSPTKPPTPCRKHKPSNKRPKSPNCMRCRLRGADKMNRSVS
ncbi:hypothetical protein KR067_013656 [Drosophila pandora]|nr:hypothetical protein KR067_013656 [Drosophila pandora]